jgi:hypothetical protein
MPRTTSKLTCKSNSKLLYSPHQSDFILLKTKISQIRDIIKMKRMDKNNKLTDSDFLILFECVSIPITSRNVSVTFSDKKFEVPDYLEDEITTRIESFKKYSRRKGFELFDDKVARLDDWSLNKNYASRTLRLDFSETSYYYFAAMNLGLDEPVRTMDSDKSCQITLRNLIRETPDDLKGSRLPNPLSVNMSVILMSPSSKSGYKSDPTHKIVLSKRGRSRTLEAQGALSSLIGGTISIGEGDLDDSGNPDIFKAVLREAKEELSLDLYDEFKNNKIAFFGLGRNISNLKPELYGEVLISGITEKEVCRAWENATDKEESRKLVFEDLNGSRIQTMIHKNKGWSPVGRTATMASLRLRSVI